jgi:protein transport protein SEC23
MDFEAREDTDGVRVSWNYLPKSKLQHERNVIPMGALYTPLNNKSDIPVADQSELVVCRQCRAIMNCFSQSSPDLWTCHMCNFTNRLTVPPVQATTVEYSTGRNATLPPIFVYLVDSCFENEDSDAYSALRDSLVLSLSLLPENALVGFISYGKHVQIHNLVSTSQKMWIFNGEKEYTLEQIQKSLGFSGLNSSSSRFTDHILQPVNVVEYQLTNIIETLVTNRFPHSEKERSLRCTGSALNIASLLLQTILGSTSSAHSTGCHLLCFIAGATTYGPGRIVGPELKDVLRSHHDLDKVNNSVQNPLSHHALFTEAKKFYHKVAKNFVSSGLSCNLFIGSYNQVGLYEMEEICLKTGGSIVMADSFNTAIFKQSLVKFFKKCDDDQGEYLEMGFNATLEVRVAPDLKIFGLIGNASGLPVKKEHQHLVSNKVVGEGNTNSWKLCNVNPQSTYGIYFEKLDSKANFTYIQFIFHYQHANGELRLRVTTVPINIIADSDVNIEHGFDQEAALVLTARDAITKLQPNPSSKVSAVNQSTVLKQIDKQLIDYCSRFALYQPGVLESFALSASYAMFPQFIYHLRRSPFITVFNNSPDESSYIRHIFMHEELTSTLIMIQPTLLSYDINTFEQEPEPVLLDSLSLGSSKILLLDTFFQILIWHGKQISEWRKAGYHEQEEYDYFKTFLEAPKKEAMEILIDRFPLPRFIDCDEGGSQARFLMAKLNPSTSYANPAHRHVIGHSLDVLTDDASIQLFMDRIQKIVISKN